MMIVLQFHEHARSDDKLRVSSVSVAYPRIQVPFPGMGF